MSPDLQRKSMKNKITLNERLTTTVAFIDKCNTIADIGSDHGYSSIFMAEEGIAKKVIATDISAPSLAKTQKLVDEFNLSDIIDCRVGDGLKVIAPNEANAALIAGMGAELIASIIENSREVADKMDFLVLQPMNSAEPLRIALCNMGYEIIDEGITLDNDKFYQIIKCRYGNSKQLSRDELEIGTFVYNKKIPLCEEFIEHLIKKYEKILEYVGNNDPDRISQIHRRLDGCRRVKEWLNVK